jgi:hypothetical protein
MALEVLGGGSLFLLVQGGRLRRRLATALAFRSTSLSDVQSEVQRMAECAVETLRDHPSGALDYSRVSLEAIEAALAEASQYHCELSPEQIRTLVQELGCYVLEVARREFGGKYLWHDKLEQPVLVVGEPAKHMAIVTWGKIQGRLAGDAGDNIPFFFSGFAERVASSQAGTHVLYV